MSYIFANKQSPPRSVLRLDPMPKSVRVYLHDANPDVDSPHFSISRDDAEYRLARKYVKFISPGVVQLLPPAGYSFDQTGMIAGGEFKSAWQPRFSANYLVWQMRPQRDPEVSPDETDKS